MVQLVHCSHCFSIIQKFTVRNFDTITEAYRYYLKHYATLGDRLYYWKVAHSRLKDVRNESTMTAIFRNVCTNNMLIEDESLFFTEEDTDHIRRIKNRYGAVVFIRK